MIPWQIAAVLALVIVVERLVDYFQRTDCNEEIRVARYEARHDSMTFRTGTALLRC